MSKETVTAIEQRLLIEGATIWKFPVPVASSFVTLKMPKNAQILTVQIQHGQTALWAVVDPKAEQEERKFLWLPTGGEVAGHNVRLDYIGTVQLESGYFVAHLFEQVGTKPLSEER